MRTRQAATLLCTPLDLIRIARDLQKKFDKARAGEDVPRVIEHIIVSGNIEEIHFVADQEEMVSEDYKQELFRSCLR